MKKNMITLALLALTLIGAVAPSARTALAQTDWETGVVEAEIIPSKKLLRLQALLTTLDGLRARVAGMIERQIAVESANQAAQKQALQVILGEDVTADPVAVPQYTNVIKNGDFNAGSLSTGGWTHWIMDDLGTMQRACDEETGNCYVEFAPKTGLREPWQTQLTQPVALSQNYEYLLAFDVNGQQRDQVIQVVMTKNYEPWTEVTDRRDVQVGTDWTPVRHVFRPSATDARGRLVFMVGGNRDVQIDNIVMLARQIPGTEAESLVPPASVGITVVNEDGEIVEDIATDVDVETNRDEDEIAVDTDNEDGVIALVSDVLSNDFETGSMGPGYIWARGGTEHEVDCQIHIEDLDHNCVLRVESERERNEDRVQAGFFADAMIKGEQYRMTFDARADFEEVNDSKWFIRAKMVNNDGKRERKLDRTGGFLVTEDWQTFDHVFTAGRTTEKTKAVFLLADGKGYVELDNIDIEHVPADQAE